MHACTHANMRTCIWQGESGGPFYVDDEPVLEERDDFMQGGQVQEAVVRRRRYQLVRVGVSVSVSVSVGVSVSVSVGVGVGVGVSVSVGGEEALKRLSNEWLSNEWLSNE